MQHDRKNSSTEEPQPLDFYQKLAAISQASSADVACIKYDAFRDALKKHHMETSSDIQEELNFLCNAVLIISGCKDVDSALQKDEVLFTLRNSILTFRLFQEIIEA